MRETGNRRFAVADRLLIGGFVYELAAERMQPEIALMPCGIFALELCANVVEDSALMLIPNGIKPSLLVGDVLL